MGKNYDNWGRLVEAVVRREQLRSLSLADSRSPSVRSLDSDYSFSSISSSQSFATTPSHLHSQLKLAQTVKQSERNKVVARTRNAVWKGLSIFRGFSSKKENERQEREDQWTKAQRTLHGLDRMEDMVFQTKEMWNRNADQITRLRELHTLKGQIEALAKTRGVDLDSIHHYYTI
ncbi:hypothetical protein ACS0TY_004717 [Phlomoides rotata]